MFKLSPRRSQRSKGFKVKHAVQLFLLLGVGIWLLYQVKHSHDKKEAFNEGTRYGNEVIKLGRKDLNPLVEGTAIQDERNVEEENEEETKHEVEESGKHGGSEDEGKGNIDDKIRRPDKEKLENEVEHEEDAVDKEKESEEKIEIKSEQGKDKETEERLEDFVVKEKKSEEGSEQMKDTEPEEHGEAFLDKEKAGEEEKEKESEEGNKQKIDKDDSDERTEAESEQRKDTEVEANESGENIKEEAKDESQEKESLENKEASEEKETKQAMTEENIEGNDEKERGNQTEDLLSTENSHDGGNLDGGVEEIENMTNKTDEFEQEKNGNGTKDADIYHPNIAAGGTVEKNDLANVNSIEEKGTQESNEHLQEGSNPAESLDSSQWSGIEMSSDSTQNQKEAIENTVSSNGDASNVDGAPGKSAAVQSMKELNSNIRFLTTKKLEAGMKRNSSINENYEASKTEGENESLNIDGHAGGGQRELVESSLPSEQKGDSSAAHNKDDAVQGTTSDVNSGAEEIGGDVASLNTNYEPSSKPSSSQEEIEESSAMHKNVDVQENESGDSSHTSMMLEEVKKARTDLTTLPETGSEGNNNEAVAAAAAAAEEK